MSVNRKTSPVGIDIIIDDIQDELYNGLINSPTPGWTIYESYPRSYKNETQEGFIPEFYTGNGEYKEVYFGDNFNATSFFLIDNTVNSNEKYSYTVDVKVIFQVKLDKLYSSIPHRADEEMHRDVILLLQNNRHIDAAGITTTTGIKKIYEDEGLIKTDGFEDMSNFHIVKFDFKVNYEYNC